MSQVEPGAETSPEFKTSQAEEHVGVPEHNSADAGSPDGESKIADDEVTPWEVGNNVDYNKLIDRFGSSPITPELLERMEKLIGEPVHPWLRRGLFFSHRDLEQILDMYERGEPFYLYTGRGPSSESLHLGHLVPFQFTQWLQRVFNVPLVIQLTDDEKFYWKRLTLREAERLGLENAKDIIACGFDVTKTFIFLNTEYIQHLYPVVTKVSRAITYNSARSTFGFKGEDSIGKTGFAAIQAAPSFSACFPHIFDGRETVACLIPCAIDQDPYFRLTREVAPSLGWRKPALIHSKFFPALQGARSKMSASSATSAIYVTDTPEQIATKIKRHAFSGGRDTLEEHRIKGGDPDIDVSYQYLSFFLDDDEKLKALRDGFRAGTISSAEMKNELIKVLVPMVTNFQQARARVTDEMVRTFMTVRKITP